MASSYSRVAGAPVDPLVAGGQEGKQEEEERAKRSSMNTLPGLSSKPN